MPKRTYGDEKSWLAGVRERLAENFPERQVHFRTDGRVSFFRITTTAQVSTLAATVLTLGWMAFSSYSFVEHERVVALKDGQIANARLAYHSLLGEVAEYQNKFNAITQDLERNHAMMLGLVERNAKLQNSLRSVSDELRTTQDERTEIVDAREQLRRKLSSLEHEMRGMTSRNFALKDNLDTVESNLQQAMSERNQARFEGTRMRTYVRQLETRLASLQETHELSVQRLTEQTVSQIDNLEHVISLTGIDPRKLTAAETAMAGQNQNEKAGRGIGRHAGGRSQERARSARQPPGALERVAVDHALHAVGGAARDLLHHIGLRQTPRPHQQPLGSALRARFRLDHESPGIFHRAR